MAQADGHYSSTKKGGSFLRFRFAKARKIKRCKSILDKLGFEYSQCENADGTTNIVVRKYNMPNWIVTGKPEP